ncbi:HET-domain-containing protein, partial [Lizonia empirigonia]
YIVLSHRWNFKSHCQTMLTNVRQRYELLPYESLSPTMRDALEVVRRLGFRFLWIDALCIIQDSDEDWLRESSKMSHVYQNAVLTIAAADCEDHEQGIFRPRAVRCARQGIRPKGTLDTRGWILQEQLLSARVLYFDKAELFWECITCSASELLRRAISGADDAALLRRHLADVWNLVVQNYSRRNLTKISDTLVALQGVMQALKLVLGEPSLAGMWKHGFWFQLVWWNDIEIDWDAETAPTFPAPSWSWMSARGAV